MLSNVSNHAVNLKWNEEKKGVFLKQIDNADLIASLLELTSHLFEASSHCDTQSNISPFYSIVNDTAVPCFSVNTAATHHNNEGNTWYYKSCKDKRTTFYNLLNVYKKNKTEQNRINMANARTDYKEFIRKRKYDYQ